MTQLVPQQDRVQTVQRWLSSPQVLAQFKTALPRLGITPERMARIVMTEVRRSPKLAECSIESLLGAAMACAQYGLEPGPMGLAWIIPYGGEAQFQLGYKGLVRLLYRSGQVKDIRCFAVAKGDTFEMDLGAEQPFSHRALVPDRSADNVVGVYCAIRTTLGGTVPEYWSFDQIEEHRDKFSKAGKGGPWVTDWIAMARKTVAIACAKFAPLSTEATSAIALDERATLGIPQGLEVEVTPEPDPKPDDPTTPEPPPSPQPYTMSAEQALGSQKAEPAPQDRAEGDQIGCPLPVGKDGEMCGLTASHDGECAPF